MLLFRKITLVLLLTWAVLQLSMLPGQTVGVGTSVTIGSGGGAQAASPGVHVAAFVPAFR